MSNLTIPEPAMIPVQLTKAAHDDARQFARQQTTNERAKQVYLRTLAVYAVHSYLRCLNVDTDLEASDLWNGLYSNLSDSANLELPGIGHLECCPVHPGADSFKPPRITGRDRIAYVAVQFKDVLDEVELIGYRPVLDANHPPEEIYVDDLQEEDGRDDGYSLFPIDNLLDYLFNIQDVRDALENAGIPLIDAIRQQLEAQFYSPSEFAVKAIAEAKNCDPDLAERRGASLLAPLYGKEKQEAAAAVSGTLSASDEDEILSSSLEDEELRQQGAQLIYWVQNILGIDN